MVYNVFKYLDMILIFLFLFKIFSLKSKKRIFIICLLVCFVDGVMNWLIKVLFFFEFFVKVIIKKNLESRINKRIK